VDLRPHSRLLAFRLGQQPAYRQHDVASEEMTITKRPCRSHGPAFKAKSGCGSYQRREDPDRAGALFRRSPEPDQAVAGLAGWGATGVFGESAKAAPEPVIDRQVLPILPRTVLASSAEVGERYVQKQLLHPTA